MKFNWYKKGNSLIRQMKSPLCLENVVTLWSLGQCGYAFSYEGKTVMVDPVLTELLNEDGFSLRTFAPPFSPADDFPVDFVLCTHNHIDHLNPATLTVISASHPNTKFVVPKPFVTLLVQEGIPADRLIGAVQDVPLTLCDEISLLPLAAPHDFYQQDEEGCDLALAYVISFGPIRLLHAGDSVVTEKLIQDVRKAGPIDVALLPINGRDYWREKRGIIGNMNPLDAVKFAESIQADLTIPTHYDMFVGNQEDPLIFARYMAMHAPARKYHIVRLGEEFLYRKR